MPANKLERKLGLMSLVATGICSMMGASIYVVPFMIQRHVPGIGPYVLPAFLMAAIPAALAAVAYAMLSAAMPRAGGSYIYVSRGLNPYLGFIASFAQWFGLSIAIGVISYIIPPFFRDIADVIGWEGVSSWLSHDGIRLIFALLLLWSFVLINLRGLRHYEQILIPMMVTMFILGLVVVAAGFMNHQDDFIARNPGVALKLNETAVFEWDLFLSAAAVLFSSFIGFDSIAQAGGEAKNPEQLLPRAIKLAFVCVALFYFFFTAAVYHAIPWQYVAEQALQGDITAPALLASLLPTCFIILIILGAAVALINDLPAMLLSVSRLFFAWSKDGIFPFFNPKINRHHVPSTALIVSGFMASTGIIGSHLAGDFFLGVDIMVTSMLINFLLMCLTVLLLKYQNPEIHKRLFYKSIFQERGSRWLVALGIVFLSFFLLVHITKDLTSELDHWYLHSTYIWIIVMAIGTLFYRVGRIQLIKKGINVTTKFSNLPDD